MEKPKTVTNMRCYSRRSFIKKAVACTAALGVPRWVYAKADKAKPLNFVFFLIDDLGWADVGCYGSTFYETPNIDLLAKQGMRFTNAYSASPVCSPTRASIMTGKNPARLGITDWICTSKTGKILKAGFPYLLVNHLDWIRRKNQGVLDPPEHGSYLPLEEVTLAETFRQAGYTTFFAGKWHLGGEQYFPEHQGFDTNIGGNDWGQPPGGYFSPYKNPQISDGPEGEYLTDRLSEEATKFLDTCKDKPFLLFLSHYSVHTPIQGKQDKIDKYEAKRKGEPEDDEIKEIRGVLTRVKQGNPGYAAMVQSVDESVGRVMKKLKELRLEENTAIVFVSDNGGQSTRETITANTPLHYGKGWLYEGGIRVPMIVKWPGTIEPGGECDEPVISHDFYPTMLDMVGLPLMPEQHVDGVSLVPLLRRSGSIDRKELYWHFPHYNFSDAVPAGAIRNGNYKLIEFFGDNHIELYDLSVDIGELNNLDSEMPERAAELKKRLYEWRSDIGARMPKNWDEDWKQSDQKDHQP